MAKSKVSDVPTVQAPKTPKGGDDEELTVRINSVIDKISAELGKNPEETNVLLIPSSGETRDIVSGIQYPANSLLLATHNQGRSLFDDIEEKSVDMFVKEKERKVKDGELLTPEALGLNLTNTQRSVFRELVAVAVRNPANRIIFETVKTEYEKGREEAKSKTKTKGRKNTITDLAPLEEDEFEIIKKYGRPIKGTINLGYLVQEVTGHVDARSYAQVRKAVEDMFGQYIFYRSGDRIRFIKPFNITGGLIDKTPGATGIPKLDLDFTLHEIFSFHDTQYILEPDNFKLILRGQNLPDMASKLLDILLVRGFQHIEQLTNNVWHTTKEKLLDTKNGASLIITTQKEINTYKKNPRRKTEGFNKVIARFLEVGLLTRYDETISKTTGGIICNFELNPDFPRLISEDKIDILHPERPTDKGKDGTDE